MRRRAFVPRVRKGESPTATRTGWILGGTGRGLEGVEKVFVFLQGPLPGAYKDSRGRTLKVRGNRGCAGLQSDEQEGAKTDDILKVLLLLTTLM